MREFKLRASASGKLATNPGKKNETLSEGTKTYLKEWMVSQIYGVEKNISSKYLNKGIFLEDEAIDKSIEFLNLGFILKNEESFEDKHFTGTPDIVLEDEIIDIKCSWDCFTFPLFEKQLPTKDYYYQLQVYMHLTGRKKARVVYVLLETPEELLYNEPQYLYSHLDKKYRIKEFNIEYDPEIIKLLQQRVEDSRIFINNLTK